MHTFVIGSQEHKSLLRISTLASIVGAIFFMIANIIHPRSPNIEVNQFQIETVAHSDIWVTDHVILWLGGLLLLAGLLAIHHSLTNPNSLVWTYLGNMSALVSTALWSVLMAMDGLASKAVHTAWSHTPPAEQESALHVAEMMEEIDIALFSFYIVLFFGITFFLYGWGVLKSEEHPAWLGWAAVLLSIASFVVGLVQAYTGLSVLVTNILFASLSSFLTLWLIIMSVRIWRGIRD